jgi:hypothetical protein
MSKPVVIDLCCGLGGWSRAFMAEGWDAIGFDIERHQYGNKAYPGHLILADVLTLNGYDLRAARPSLVVASPPCQKYSYMAMPFSRGKAIAATYRANPELIESELNALYRACFRIASELDVPIVLENVKGAQPWVGRAKANYGSYYLWGDIANVGGRIVRSGHLQFGVATVKALKSTKNTGGSWFAVAHNTESGKGRNPDGRPSGLKSPGRNFHAYENGLGSSPSFNGADHETRGVKVGGSGAAWFREPLQAKRRQGTAVKNGRDWFGVGADCSEQRRHASGSTGRKAASALIAEIPFELAQYIARVFKP